MKTKVLIVGEYPPPTGGIGAYIKGILDTGLGKKFELRLYKTNRFKDKTPSNKTGYAKIFETKPKRLIQGIAITLKNILLFPFSILVYNPKIVYINSAGDITFFEYSIYAWLSKLLRKRIFFHMHNGFFLEFFSHSPGFIKAYIKWTFNQSEKNFFLTEGWVKKYKSIGIKNAYVVHPFIDLKHFSDLDLRNKNKETKIIFLGFYSASKGIYDLVDAAEILKENLDCHFDFYGEGDKDGLVKYILKKKLTNEISVHDKIVDLDLKNQILNEADILVLLEAMATGLGIVASNVGGVPDLITDRKNGMLFKAMDSKDLAAKILDLGINKNLLSFQKKLNHKRILGFTKEQTIQTLSNFFNDR